MLLGIVVVYSKVVVSLSTMGLFQVDSLLIFGSVGLITVAARVSQLVMHSV